MDLWKYYNQRDTGLRYSIKRYSIFRISTESDSYISSRNTGALSSFRIFKQNHKVRCQRPSIMTRLR